MTDFLETMAAASRERAAQARRLVPEGEVKRLALDRPHRQRFELHPGGFDIIAEIKRRAPSAGTLHADDVDAERFIVQQAEAYAHGGASAISMLTEPVAFKGNMRDLELAATASPLPVMRKDFIVDPYQVYEAKASDASGILLIAQLIERKSLPAFLDAAHQTRQFVLLEVFEEAELAMVDAAIQLAQERSLMLLVGVNARNLVTLQVDTDRFARLAAELPADVPRVAESGLETEADIRSVASLGYCAALIGTSLMRSERPAGLLADLIDAGREAVNPCR